MRSTLRKLAALAIGVAVGGGFVLAASAQPEWADAGVKGPPAVFCEPNEHLVALAFFYSDDHEGAATPEEAVAQTIDDAVRTAPDGNSLKAPAAFLDSPDKAALVGDLDAADGESVRSRWYVEREGGQYRVHELYVCEGEFEGGVK